MRIHDHGGAAVGARRLDAGAHLAFGDVLQVLIDLEGRTRLLPGLRVDVFFKPDETVYVSLLSDDPGYGTITVRWLFNGTVVSEAKRDVSYTRAAATEFHLQNSGGFPQGSYRVEILINGEPAGSRDFRVEP